MDFITAKQARENYTTKTNKQFEDLVHALQTRIKDKSITATSINTGPFNQGFSVKLTKLLESKGYTVTRHESYGGCRNQSCYDGTLDISW